MSAPVCLYQLVDENDAVVYVGSTRRPKQRAIQHRHLGKQFDRIEVLSWFPDRDAALESERDLIEELNPPLNKMMPVSRHGETGMYARGCRCAPCSEAETARALATQANARATQPDYLLKPEVHGNLATYTNWRCRCSKCRTAKRDYERGRIAKRAVEQAVAA